MSGNRRRAFFSKPAGGQVKIHRIALMLATTSSPMSRRAIGECVGSAWIELGKVDVPAQRIASLSELPRVLDLEFCRA